METILICRYIELASTGVIIYYCEIIQGLWFAQISSTIDICFLKLYKYVVICIRNGM